MSRLHPPPQDGPEGEVGPLPAPHPIRQPGVRRDPGKNRRSGRGGGGEWACSPGDRSGNRPAHEDPEVGGSGRQSRGEKPPNGSKRRRSNGRCERLVGAYGDSEIRNDCRNRFARASTPSQESVSLDRPHPSESAPHASGYLLKVKRGRLRRPLLRLGQMRVPGAGRVQSGRPGVAPPGAAAGASVARVRPVADPVAVVFHHLPFGPK